MLNVTICILSYNRGAYLREAVESVLSQSSRPSKIVIFDNGSQTDVQAAVADYLHQGVQWVGSKENHGASWNFDRAIRSIETPYYVLFHDDDRLCSRYLEELVRYMDGHPSVAVVSCNGYVIGAEGQRTGEVLVPTSTDGTYEVYDCSGQVAFKYARNAGIPLAPALYRSEMVRGVPFREDFEKVADAVYFCDLAEVGEVAYFTGLLYECRQHEGQDSCSFSAALCNKLEYFFETRTLNDESQRPLLRDLLTRQHTARNIKLVVACVAKGDLRGIWPLVMDERFKFSNVLPLVFSVCMRVLRGGRASRVNYT